jgi:hypothetical protein
LTSANEIPKHEKPWKEFVLNNKVFKGAGGVLAFATIVFTVLALAPAFSGQKISKESLDLAKWTAWKEFIEKCNEVVVSGFCIPVYDHSLTNATGVRPTTIACLPKCYQDGFTSTTAYETFFDGACFRSFDEDSIFAGT